MSTVFSQVVGAVLAALQASPPVCEAIHRARTNVMPDDEREAVSVQWEQSQPQPGTIAGAPIDWSTRLTVECYARSVEESGDVAVDPLLQRVYERLAADPSLGGTVTDLQFMGVEAENTAEGKKTGWVRLVYVADHRTYNGILS